MGLGISRGLSIFRPGNGLSVFNDFMSPLQTGQTTVYAIGDDADVLAGIAKSYTVLTTGPQSGTSTITLPAYAANTLAFVSATKKITDSAAGLAQIKTGDTIVIEGSGSNDKVCTVATGNVAGEVVVNEALTDEAAGAYITISKRGTLSNNLVVDNNTGLIWARYNTAGMTGKLGPASDGYLYWTGTGCTLHPAAADLQMVGGTKGIATIKVVGGAGEVARYHAGHSVICTGFAQAVNNLGPCRVVSVTVNGADLDIVVMTGNRTPVSEAADGSRTIAVACNGVFGFKDAANVAALGGYSDWRLPNFREYADLPVQDAGIGTGKPDSTAFPSWTAARYWASTTDPNDTAYAFAYYATIGSILPYAKTVAYGGHLVRGGRIS